jgi:hypothetical protein
MFDIRQFCYDFNLTQVAFGNIINETQPTVSLMVKGSRSVRKKHIELLRAEYGDCVESYIINEDTKRIFTSPQPRQVTATIIPAEVVDDIKKEQYQEANSAVVIEQPPLVPDNIVRKPEVDILEWADNADNEHTQNAFNIANILKRTRFIIKMNNSAMLPTLSQTDFLFLKPFADGSEIIDGEIYGIETRAWGILIRHLYNDGDHILARPKNTLEYGDIRIPKKDVRNKYHIVFRGSTSLSSTPNNEAEHIKQLQRQGEHITSLIDEVVSAGKRQDRLIAMLEKKQ